MFIPSRLRRLTSRALRIAPALLLAAAAARAQALRPGPEVLRVGAMVVTAPAGAVVAKPIRVCGTATPSPGEVQGVQAALERWRDEGLGSTPGAAAGGTIRVAFHVITARGEGNVSDAQIEALLRDLNRDYAASGYQFVLASVDRTEESGWFRMTPGSGRERKAKQALAVDPAHHLNLYVCGLGQSLLGWASFPWAAPESDVLQGVVIDPSTLPAPGDASTSSVRIASHEVGHYLGLIPDEDAPGELGSEQVERMRAIVPVYRPSLFAAPRVAVANWPEISPSEGAEPEEGRVLSYRGAFPNPFRAETALRFTLPSTQPVSLRIYSVTGQLVRTLVEATLPPGDHSAMFRADGLPSGAYFAVLKAGSVHMSRTLMLIR